MKSLKAKYGTVHPSTYNPSYTRSARPQSRRAGSKSASSFSKQKGKKSNVVVMPKAARRLAKGGLTRKEVSKINKAAHKKMRMAARRPKTGRKTGRGRKG